jgi:hypothetical protein
VLSFPPVVYIEAKPNLICKAVLGHLLSARLSNHDSFYDLEIKEILFDKNKTIPERINIFFWVYPYALQVVFRYAVLLSKKAGNRETPIIGLLKYFPIAYLVTDAKRFDELDSLTTWRDQKEDFTIKVPIRLSDIRPSLWPEQPTPTKTLFIGEDGMESLRAHPKQHLIRNSGAQRIRIDCVSAANHNLIKALKRDRAGRAA